MRQGDPLSPYLFILVFDVLARLISRALSEGEIHGPPLGPRAPILTHLFVADDALIFAKASNEEVFQIFNILNIFIAASG